MFFILVASNLAKNILIFHATLFCDSAPVFGLYTSKNKSSLTLKNRSRLFVEFSNDGSPENKSHL